MRPVAMLVLLMVLVSMLGCAKKPVTSQTTPEPVVNRDSPQAVGNVNPNVVQASNDFGFRLYRELAKNDGSGNLFISPVSLEIALAMAYNGARGETQTQMAKTLGISGIKLEDVNASNAALLKALSNPDPKVKLSIANSLWCMQGAPLVSAFVERCDESYGAKVTNLDFRAVESEGTINQWANEQTRSMIPEIVSYEDIKDAYLVLANASYFEGEWTLPFDSRDTRDGTFTLLDGSTKKLPMMTNWDDFDYLETSRLQAIKLPYGDKSLYSIVVLPKRGVKLSDLTRDLTPKIWAKWEAGLQGAEGSITLPRFSIECSAALKDTLTSMGMGVAFDGTQADFTGMIPKEALTSLPGRPFITDVFHKTVLEVYEEGARAAAVTAMPVAMGGPPPSKKKPFVMRVDHPFIFAICDKRTGAIIFFGTIVDPEKLVR